MSDVDGDVDADEPPTTSTGDDDAADDAGDANDGRRPPPPSPCSTYLVKLVVDDPDAVRIDPIDPAATAIRLDVRVGPGDMGRVIGKRGRVANAIRTVVRAAAVRDGVDVDIEFVD